MNDACEMWSLPWHSLQRSLADTFTAVPVARQTPMTACAGSWLARARTRTAPTLAAARHAGHAANPL